jgi:hypothetical protein
MGSGAVSPSKRRWNQPTEYSFNPGERRLWTQYTHDEPALPRGP